MEIPNYIKNADQENYNEEVNLAMQQCLSQNGFIIPSLTADQITAATMLVPPLPDGMLWFCNNSSPPVYVGLISGSLVKFTTSSFP